MTSEQRALADYMSDLSEDAWRAGWMDGLEFALWEAVLGQRREYGRLAFTAEHLTNLRSLSDRCGGWIVYLDAVGETWVPIDDWRVRFAAAHPPFEPEVNDG